MTNHPDDILLLGWLDGEAAAETAGGTSDLIGHLAGCEACQTRLAILADETAVLRSVLALTPAELHQLHQADLAGRLVTTVRTASASTLISLVLLFGGCLAIAAAWAVVGPLAEPFLSWFARFASVTTLMSLAAAQGLAVTVGLLFTVPLPPVGQFVDLLLILMTGVLLVSLWRFRLGTPATNRSVA